MATRTITVKCAFCEKPIVQSFVFALGVGCPDCDTFDTGSLHVRAVDTMRAYIHEAAAAANALERVVDALDVPPRLADDMRSAIAKTREAAAAVALAHEALERLPA